MIVNLLAATRLVLDNANLNEDDIRYVTYYNDDTDEQQFCPWCVFVDVADEINYDENDSTFTGRRIIKPELSIVATDWWLRRTRDDEEVETWVYQDMPPLMEDMVEGINEFDVKYVIADIDVMSDEYKELVEDTDKEYPFAKATTIEINGNDYSTINDDGVDKVINNGNVAIILAAEGRWWTWSSSSTRDIRMLFDPNLVKIVLEGTYLTDDFNLEEIGQEIDLDVSCFSVDSFESLVIKWVPKDIQFNIISEYVDRTNTIKESLEFPTERVWLNS